VDAARRRIEQLLASPSDPAATTASVTRLECPSSFAAAADAPVALSATVVAPTATTVAGATVAAKSNAVAAALSGRDRRGGVEGGARVGDGEGCEHDVQLPGSVMPSVEDDERS